MNLSLTPRALKTLASLPVRDRDALIRKLKAFAADPTAAHPWAKPLTGMAQTMRVRQGDWRAICRLDRAGDAVIVEAIGNRKEVYR